MLSEALAKEGGLKWYVYLLECENTSGERYVGLTVDLKRRLVEHNAGKSAHTSKFLPWSVPKT